MTAIDPHAPDALHGAFTIPDWYTDALCAQTDPEAFFPEKGGATRPAKAVCAQCPVKAECLALALANNERAGIWGGLTYRERLTHRKDAA